MKNINFISGFHRSGSTLLTVLLNQHPEIYASHQSDLNSALDLMQGNFNNFESFLAGNSTYRWYQMLADMPQAFYKDVEKPIIFDKSRAWGHLDSFKYMHMINKEYKVLYTHRPVLEVLASIVTIHRNNPDNIFMKNTKDSRFPSLLYRSDEEALCDYFMTNLMDKTISTLGTFKKEEHKDNVLFISYDELTKNTQDIMNKVYSFMGTTPFVNDLSNIQDKEKPDDTYFGAELHKVSSKIEKSKNNYEEILSPYVIQRYGNVLDGLI